MDRTPSLKAVVPVARTYRPPSPSAATYGSSPAPRLIHVFLGRTSFCYCWWLVLSVHAFLGAFAFSTAALHWYLQKDVVAMSVNSLHVSPTTLELTAQVFLLVGLCHIVAITRVLHHSIQARTLILHAPAAAKPVKARTNIRRIFQVVDVVTSAWHQLFGPTGIFGFRNPHFEAMFLWREAWEILLQTYQAFKLSQSVPRRGINQLAVAVIVLNCVGSPLVQVLFRRNDRLRRIVILLQDAVLDLCCSIVIPLSILMPYVRQYDTSAYTFAPELIMDDVWFVNAISETRQVLVTSFPDFVATLMPQLSLLGYMMTFKNILRRRSTSVRHEPPHPSTTDGPTLTQKVNVVSISTRSTPVRWDASSQTQDARTDRRTVLDSALHVLFVLWGCAVLGLHLQASRNTDRHVPGCQLHVSAWYSSAFPCSVMQLNCHAIRIDGTLDETTALLSQLERSTLQVLVLSHCPGLAVPSVVTTFDQLTGIEIFNSTLVSWPTDAAIREATQPRIGYIYFVLTNWTSFPSGLLHDELPRRFRHFFLVASNVTDLPDRIGLWHRQPWITIALERLPLLTHLPDAFCRLETSALSVAATALTSIPSACTFHARLSMLGLSYTGVQSLLDVVGPNLEVLIAQHTALAAFPLWFQDWSQRTPAPLAALYGSAVCNSTMVVGDDDALGHAACESDLADIDYAYPLEMMQRLRPVDPVST